MAGEQVVRDTAKNVEKRNEGVGNLADIAEETLGTNERGSRATQDVLDEAERLSRLTARGSTDEYDLAASGINLDEGYASEDGPIEVDSYPRNSHEL